MLFKICCRVKVTSPKESTLPVSCFRASCAFVTFSSFQIYKYADQKFQKYYRSFFSRTSLSDHKMILSPHTSTSCRYLVLLITVYQLVVVQNLFSAVLYPIISWAICFFVKPANRKSHRAFFSYSLSSEFKFPILNFVFHHLRVNKTKHSRVVGWLRLCKIFYTVRSDFLWSKEQGLRRHCYQSVSNIK